MTEKIDFLTQNRNALTSYLGALEDAGVERPGTRAG